MENILLGVYRKRNFQLLKKLLDDSFSIKRLESPEDFNNKLDLLIVDNYNLKRFNNGIEKLKKSEEFLPILYINSQRNKTVKDSTYELVDDLINIPISKRVLKLRINNLIKLRLSAKESEIKYNKLIENSHVGVCILKNKKIVSFNDNFKSIFENDRELTGADFFEFVNEKHKEILLKKYDEFKNNRKETEPLEIKIATKKIEKWLNLRLSLIPDGSSESVLLIALDVTNNKKAIKKIDFLNKHDNLTGLYNRAYLEYQMKKMDRANNLPITFIMGDIDGLKLINDGFGHDIGDKVIIEVSDIIKECCRKEDKVFRIGGDEILIILPNTNQIAANKVIKRIENKLENKEKEFANYSISLGSYTKRKIDDDIEMVYSEAEDRMYQNKLAKSESTRNSIIKSLEKALEEKTDETREHAERMRYLAKQISKELGLEKSIEDELNLLTRLHDIGKVAISESILNKPDKLSDDEWQEIKKHPAIGYRIIKAIPHLARVANDILYHHERWDGTGYPRGLKETEIPLTSRIITIIDAYDVMTHKRPYKEPMSQEEAIQEIKDCSGTQFDPNIAEVFIRMLKTSKKDFINLETK